VIPARFEPLVFGTLGVLYPVRLCENFVPKIKEISSLIYPINLM
jgi:hypothetical protein